MLRIILIWDWDKPVSLVLTVMACAQVLESNS